MSNLYPYCDEPCIKDDCQCAIFATNANLLNELMQRPGFAANLKRMIEAEECFDFVYSSTEAKNNVN